MTAGEPLKLHLGAWARIPGWTNVNINPGPEIDVVADVADLSGFADGSVDEVYASHVFEHLSMGRVGPALLGVHRIIKPGGIFRIAVPDLERLAMIILDDHVSTYGVWEACRRIFGGDMDQNDRHGCGFTADTMTAALEQSGFTNIKRVNSFGLLNDASELTFLGYRISLNMEATKPCKPNA
jgi:predicted SAM-dependent methyltransferase